MAFQQENPTNTAIFSALKSLFNFGSNLQHRERERIRGIYLMASAELGMGSQLHLGEGGDLADVC